MRREHAVLSKLYAAYPLAPRSYLLCTDHAMVGSDFVLEERKHGIAIRRDLPSHVRRRRRRSARALARRLSTRSPILHRVDVAAVGLSDLGRPDRYVARQLEGWSGRYEAARTAESADATWIAAWLRDRLPDSPAATLVHNDFKLDNLLLDAAEPSRITAVLDWDMCTYGDPLMDLGYALALWPDPSDPPAFRLGAMPTWHDGFPSRVRRQSRNTQRAPGFNVDHISWYVIFNIFRFAAIIQQIYKRFNAGQTHDERFRGFGKQANVLIGAATLPSAKLRTLYRASRRRAHAMNRARRSTPQRTCARCDR